MQQQGAPRLKCEKCRVIHDPEEGRGQVIPCGEEGCPSRPTRQEDVCLEGPGEEEGRALLQDMRGD